MLQHLPEPILWSILLRANDIKACAAVRCCNSMLYNKYNMDYFWELMCHWYYPMRSLQCMHSMHSMHSLHSLHSLPWMPVFWHEYSKAHGCAYCGDKNKFLCADTMDIPGCNITIHLCKRCKNVLGDTLVHKNVLQPWQLNMLSKRRSRSPHTTAMIFGSYYGDKQVSKCQSYYLKCTECLKNIRNMRCPKYQCGTCCQCKFHKSHYEQASPCDAIMSCHITNLLKHTNDRKKRHIIIYKA
jgi:hypothetical protein